MVTNRKIALVISYLIVSATGAYADDIAPANASAEPAPTWTFPGSISLVSDYMWHGQTQTWGHPAIQAGIEADHESGFYAGFWASNVSSHWLPNASLETDWSVGIRNSFATDYRYDVGATYVYYPNANFDKTAIGINPGTGEQFYKSSKLNTVEIYGSFGWKWFTVKAGLNPTKFYGWNTQNSSIASLGAAPFPGDPKAEVTGSTKGSGYVMASASYDLPAGFNVSGEVGHQMIRNTTGIDWSWWKAGVTKSFDGGWSINGSVSGTWGTDAFNDYPSFDDPASAITHTKDVDKPKAFFSLTKSF